MSIMSWPETQRPREKILAQGPGALSDAELVALFLRTGVRGKNAVELAATALRAFDGLNGLLSAPMAKFAAVPGLGVAKYTQLQAVREMARRAMAEGLRVGNALNRPERVHEFLRLQLGWREREVFLVLYLDTRLRLLAAEEMFLGSLSSAPVHPREIVRSALARNASGLIVAHNHPSGLAAPSAADEEVTQRLAAALDLVEITLLDHVIVAGNTLFSFHQHGLLKADLKAAPNHDPKPDLKPA